MKVLQFTIPVANENAIIVKEEKTSQFYDHLHRHLETQITWIIKGEGTLVVGNYMQPFVANDIFVIGANLPHILKNDINNFKSEEEDKVHALTFFFNANDFFNPMLDMPEMRGIKKFIENSEFGLQIPPSKIKEISFEMQLVQTQKNGYKFAAFIHLLQSLADIKNMKILSSITPDYAITQSQSFRMDAVYQYALNHYAENIKLSQIASIANMTTQAFCRYFKKHTQKTFVNFLNEIRINEACKKLTETGFDSIATVAYSTGFNSPVSFNRVFKNVTGRSPGTFLRDFNDKVN